MKVVWTLENIKKNFNTSDYYINSKLNVLMLLASVSLWKRNHKEDRCILFADDLTIDLFDKMKVLELWDNVKPLPNKKKINRDVFWAASKVEVLSTFNEPVLMLDNDTHVYRPIWDKLDKNTSYVTNYEVGKGYYPSGIDPYIQKLSYKSRWNPKSVNVSFLYLPDPEFTKIYTDISLNMMEELTDLKAPNPQYLIFAEQLLLSNLFDKHKVKNKSIISTNWNCSDWEWGEDHNNGLWNYKESLVYFKHYGPLKGYIRDSRGGQNYNREVMHLLNCINIPNLDLSLIEGK